jgi:hypothetical protein
MPPPRAHAHRLFCRGQEWYGAIILKWAGDRALIHYIGWQTMWNEWFSREDMMKRTRPLTANPRFGILATKDERNRVKRCLNLADELWGAGHDDSGGVEGGPGNGGGDRKDDEGSDEGDAAASNAEEGGSPREEQDEGGGGQPVDAQRALLDFVASLQGQQERADTAHEIEQSAAVARDVPDAPLVVVGASQEESEQEESDESDEDGSMSETGSGRCRRIGFIASRQSAGCGGQRRWERHGRCGSCGCPGAGRERRPVPSFIDARVQRRDQRSGQEAAGARHQAGPAELQQGRRRGGGCGCRQR